MSERVCRNIDELCNTYKIDPLRAINHRNMLNGNISSLVDRE